MPIQSRASVRRKMTNINKEHGKLKVRRLKSPTFLRTLNKNLCHRSMSINPYKILIYFSFFPSDFYLIYSHDW